MNSTSNPARVSVPSARLLRSFQSTLCLGVLTLADAAQAHPGHSLGDASVSHVLTSPNHLAALAVFGLGLFVGAQFVQRQLPRRALQCGGALTLACAAVLWGMRG